MLKLHNVRIEPSKVRKVREPPNATKELSHIILKLYNVRMEPLNVRKKKKTIEYDKRTITCNVEIIQCKDETVKCEKKIREPPNVTKELSYVMLESYNV